jgi:Tfp pilus assembly protein PilN
MIVMLLIVAASIASSLSYTANADREINRQYETRLTLYREQAARVRLAEQRKDQGVAVAAKAAFDASLLDAVPPSRALAEVFNAVPAGARLTGISLERSAASHGAALVHIHGMAQTDSQISQFVARLNKSSWFGGVQLLPGNAARAPRKFEITATIETQRVPR